MSEPETIGLRLVGPDYYRKQFIGGSDIAAIIGVSPWGSRVSVWKKKMAQRGYYDDKGEGRERPAKRKLFNRGKLWEKVVAEMLEAKLIDQGHTVKILGMGNRYVDPQVSYFAAEIDMELQIDDLPETTNVELKTVHPNAGKHWGEEETDECPVQYAAQAMWGLGVTSRKCCIVAPLFGADEIRVYWVLRDDQVIESMRAQATEFWECFIKTGVSPPPSSLNEVELLYPQGAKGETVVEAEPYIMEKLFRWAAIDAQIDAHQAERDALEFEIKRFMGSATVLRAGGIEKPAVTWRDQARGAFDSAEFKAAYPKLYKQFYREGVCRVFKVNSLKEFL